MSKMLGIDLGSSAVKLTLYEGSMRRRTTYKGGWTRPVPQDAQTPPTLEVRLETLRALLGDLFPDEVPPVLVMAFPAEDTSVRLIKLPFGDRSQVERALPFEVEGQVPFDLEDVVLAHRVLNLSAGESRVLAVLADKLKVGEWLKGLEGLALNPKHLVVDADLLGTFARSGVQAVVDIGHTRTLVTVCQDGAVVGARALSGGGRDLTLALCQHLNLEWDAAVDLKHRSALGDDTAPDARAGRVLRDALEPLLSDLRATLIGIEDSYEVGVDEVLVCGGTAELSGLVELLREDLGVIVRRVPLPEEGAELGLAAGLALALGHRAAGGAHSPDLDLRLGEFAFKGDITAYSSLVLYGAAGVLAFLVAGVGLYGYQSYKTTQAREAVEANISQLVMEGWPEVADPARVQDTTVALAIASEQVTAEREEVAALAGVLTDVPPTLNVLREISEGVPPPADAKVDVTELSIMEESIQLKIDTDGFESATKIENGLKTRPLFTNASGGDSKKVGDIVRFTVTIPLEATAEGEDGSEG